MNKYRKLTLDTVLFGVSTFASKILVFLLLPLYTSFLNTEEYGIADLLNNIVNLIYPILTLAIAEGCLRFAFMKDVKKNEIVSVCVSFILISTLLLLFIYPFSHIFGTTMKDYWIFFVLLYFGYTTQNCFSFYCRGINKNLIFAIQGIVQTVILIVLNILFLVIFKWGLTGFLISTIVSYLVSSLVMFIFADIYKDLLKFRINWSLIKEMLKYSLPIIPTMIFWWINNSVDKYFIIAFEDIGASGIYSVAHKIPSLLTTVASVFNNAWSISAISEENSSSKVDFYSNVFKFYLFLMIFVGAFVSVLSPILCKILFSNDYYIGWIYVAPLVCAAVFSALAGFLASIFRASKKTNILFISTAIGAIVNIILNYQFINRLGTIGVAFATMVSFLVVFIIRLMSCMKIVKLKIEYFKLISSLIMLMVLSIIICNNYEFKYLISLGIMIALSVIFSKDIKKFINVAFTKMKNIYNKKGEEVK